MQIQCPSCRARARLSDDHEGAKVRCAECGRVFVARPSGAKGASGGSQSGLWIGGFVAVLAGIGVFALYRSSRKEEVTRAAPPAPVVEPEPTVVDYGWDSAPVRFVVRLHAAAHAGDLERVRAALDGPRLWAREHVAADGLPDTSVPSWEVLSAPERSAALDRWATDLISGPGKELVADWEPYDGETPELSDELATVRVAVKPRAGGIENHWLEWKLSRDGQDYKAWSWERWVSPEEAKAERQKRARGYEVVTLSDGSVVHERQPEPLEHLESTPPELRARIDRLVATMLDLDLTKEGSRAQRELVEIGKPSIPILLTKLYEIPVDTEPDRIRCNLVDQALQRITGQSFGYAPGESGSAAGTTEERRESSIRQWFAWWYRNQDRFTEKKVEDALEGLIELDEKEKRWLERHKD